MFLTLPPAGINIRAWFPSLDRANGNAAAFDIRLEGYKLTTGQASKGIAKRLREHGLELVVEPESFLVDNANRLLAGELDRARGWGKAIAVTAGKYPSRQPPVHGGNCG